MLEANRYLGVKLDSEAAALMCFVNVWLTAVPAASERSCRLLTSNSGVLIDIIFLWEGEALSESQDVRLRLRRRLRLAQFDLISFRTLIAVHALTSGWPQHRLQKTLSLGPI